MIDLKGIVDWKGPLFSWSGWLIGLISAALAVIALLDQRRKVSLNLEKHLREIVEKNVDKNLTDAQIESNKSELASISTQIAELRCRIDTEIPLEAKRTVLRDRLDASIKNLRENLALTLELKNDLEELGSAANLHPDLLAAVNSEISPESVKNARHESLKTLLIVILFVSVLISSLVPAETGLLVQVPLAAMGVFCLYQVVRSRAARMAYPLQRDTLRMTIAGLVAGAITAGMVAGYLFLAYIARFSGELGFWDDLMDSFILPSALVLGIVLIFALGWFVKRPGRIVRVVGWLLLTSLAVFCLALYLTILYESTALFKAAALYISLLGTAALTFATIAIRMVYRLKRLERDPSAITH